MSSTLILFIFNLNLSVAILVRLLIEWLIKRKDLFLLVVKRFIHNSLLEDRRHLREKLSLFLKQRIQMPFQCLHIDCLNTDFGFISYCLGLNFLKFSSVPMHLNTHILVTSESSGIFSLLSQYHHLKPILCHLKHLQFNLKSLTIFILILKMLQQNIDICHNFNYDFLITVRRSYLLLIRLRLT